MDGWVGGCVEGWEGGWVGGWMDACMYNLAHKQEEVSRIPV